MKKMFVFILFFISLSSFGQKFNIEYNTVIDYDGEKRREYSEIGKISLTDSLLTIDYKKGYFTYKVYKITSNKVYYFNEYGESVKVLFTSTGDVTRVNETRPGEYIIYRKK